MKKKKYGTVIHAVWPFVFLGLLLTNQCMLLKPRYNPAAIEEIRGLKADALELMDKAREDYHRYEDRVQALKIRVEKSYKRAKSRLFNKEVIKQWKEVRYLFGSGLIGFLEVWMLEGRLSREYISSAKGRAARRFDSIIHLEEQKRNSHHKKKKEAGEDQKTGRLPDYE